MKSHVVKTGDTLTKIARKNGTSIADILEVNPQITDRNAIAVGQIISIPENADVPPPLPKAIPVGGSVVNESVARVLERARQILGKKIKYDLGAGGMLPTMASPANLKNACDCSGFVSWCFGMSRKTEHPLYVKFNGGWINTDAMVHDAKKQTGFFRQLSSPKVGCIVVFPGPPLRRIGHVGLVTEVDDTGTVATEVIHCSSGNFRNFGDAIRETSLGVFQKPDTIFAWYEGVDD